MAREMASRPAMSDHEIEAKEPPEESRPTL
jgi:hypothetical protein